ncbi:MAG: ABC transporter ATP-binding protein [Candidatus Poribacteria bacterium]|nr:ABC transporter ATP-binding protein [Candidatus Poribacteria bacterium]
MPQLDSLPAPVEAALTRASVQPDTIRIAAKSDVNDDGTFGASWFLVTETELIATDGNGSVLRRIALADVKGVRSESVVDGGLIVVRAENDSMDFLRYSNATAKKLAYVTRYLEEEMEHRNGKRDIEPVWDYEAEKIDPITGLPIKEGELGYTTWAKKRQAMMRVVGYLAPYKVQAAFMALMMVVGTVISMVPMYFTRVLIDDVLNLNAAAQAVADDEKLNFLSRIFRGFPSAAMALAVAIGCLATTYLITHLIEILRGRLGAWLTLRMSADIRDQLYQKLHSLALRFFDKRQTGTVISHITQDADRLQSFLLDGLQFLVVEVLMLFAIGFILFRMNPVLAGLILIPVPIMIFGARWFWKKVRNLWHQAWRRSSKLYDVVNDSISGIRVVRAFGQQKDEIERFGVANREARDYNLSAEILWATYFPILGMSFQLGTIIVWYWGGLDVIGNGMSLGTLMLFHGYLGMFYGPLRHISPIINWASRAMTAAERIFEVIDSEPEQLDDGSLVDLPDIRGEVEFRHMTFGYESHKPVLRDVNIHVKPGEMIGLVGHSGAGKSTMINLICRFYTADAGNILIDDVDIKKIRLDDLRRQIGVVLQEPYLFNGTIAENIAYAKPGATMDEVIQAAKAANAHEFVVKFPDGYDTEVGERGGRLSGGERQRISIARAVLHNPRILILDEATSSVDVETEKKIQEAIDRLVKNRTTFAIAHRLSTLRNANRLLVLDKGRVTEMGTHEELMEKKGIYFKLVETQRKAAEIRSQSQVVAG